MELMDCEVPDCQGVVPGVGRDQDDNRRALDDYYLTHELLELLLRRDGDASGSSSVVAHENGASLMDDIPPLLPPPLSPLQTYHSAGNPFAGNGIPSDAEMASWLCQVFEQEATDDHEPRGAATATTTTTTTKSEGGNTNTSLPSSSCGTGEHRSITSAAAPTASLELAADGPADDCRRGRSSSGRRRSCSGKAAEQRRRDKINDKMRTLQQLMPRCSKTDKASTLEEVIKYVKSLQHQVQVMSAAGYAIPTPFLPLGMMPPSCMQLPAGGQPPVMLPQYPVFPAAYSCPHHGTPLPMSAPCARRPAAGEPRIAPRRHLVPNDFTVPSHSACGRSQK